MARNALPPARRPSELALDSLVGAGPEIKQGRIRMQPSIDPSDRSGTSGTSEILGTSGVVRTSGNLETSGPPVTLGVRAPGGRDGPLSAIGTSGTSGPSGADAAALRARRSDGGSSDLVHGPAVAPTGLITLTDLGTSDTTDTPRTSDTLGTSGDSGTSDTPSRSGDIGRLSNSGALSTPPTRSTEFVMNDSKLSPREHVKIARPLADEMRDAVWFFSDNGRPRVRLGDLLDEAVRSWLEASKQNYNNNADFPMRGPLR